MSKKISIIHQYALIMFLTAAFLSATTQLGHATEKHGMDCTKCHKLTKQEAKNLLAHNPQLSTAEIIDIKQSPIKGLWQVTAQKGDKKGIFYIDISKNYVITGDIYSPKKSQNITLAELEKVINVKVPETIIKNSLLLGSPNAKIRATVFTDPQCPHCLKLHHELKKVVAQRKDIAFNLVLYPVMSVHPTAYDQAKSVYCTKSIKTLEDAYNGTTLPFATCDATAIDQNMEFAQKYGITGTPTIVLPNGNISYGFIESKAIITLLEARAK